MLLLQLKCSTNSLHDAQLGSELVDTGLEFSLGVAARGGTWAYFASDQFEKSY